MYVTVGYIPTTSNSTSGELSLTAPTEPVKYMDYVFTRGENREWYLSALQESEMKVEATPEPSPTAAVTQDTQSMVESQLDSTLTGAASDVDAEEGVQETPVQEETSEAPTEETTQEPAEDATSEETVSEDTASSQDAGSDASGSDDAVG